MSPTIQEGAELPVESSKNAPRHDVRVKRDRRKSAGLIVQLREPPNESVTFTVVSQAALKVISISDAYIGMEVGGVR